MWRLKVRGRRAVYHCVSRTVNRELLFDPGAKEMLRRMLWRVADFSGVRVLSYCVMGNHFHVLLEVPEEGSAREAVGDAELVRRYGVLYAGGTRYRPMPVEVFEQVLGSGGSQAEALRERYLRRMHDVSAYMKTLKQRYTLWYNRTHGRVGTLWSERFKSVLVEERGLSLQIVSGYIDLNAVRAGLVADPKEYRWSSYGEACGGSERARRGLLRSLGEGKRWAQAERLYREYLYCTGRMPAAGKGGAGAVLQGGGRLTVPSALRCRVRYFTDGAVLGTRGWVEAVFREHRERFGSKRRTGARRMRGSDWGGMTVLRDLRRDVFG